MPQFTTFTVKDGSATPVDVTYSPEALAIENTVLVDRRLAVRSEQPFLKSSFSAPTATRPTFKLRRFYSTPIVRDGVIVGVLRTEVTQTVPTTASQSERKHHSAFVSNSENHSQVKGQLIDLETWY